MVSQSSRPRFQRKFFLYCINTALAAFSAQASATEFHTAPILATGASFPPNILLTLSVEFPTAGAAYQSSLSTNNRQPLINQAEFDKNEYIGYFDPKKCYDYKGNENSDDDDNGYFTPVHMADARGYCGGNLFSGKALNWMTMTTIDIFRQAMTGGNRALGTASAQSNYNNADQPGFTTLRRANVDPKTNRRYGLHMRFLENDGLIRNILPSNVIDAVEKFNKEFEFGPNKTKANRQVLHINNHGFKLRIGGSSMKNDFPVATGKTSVKSYNVVVEVCKPGLEEDNCRTYTDPQTGKPVLKPVGVMQNKVESARFGVFSYANIDGNNIDGGVLRARMKSLQGETTHNGISLGEEINSNGTFAVNPDEQDARNTSVTNSGVINYLNKFGDAGKYKSSDPAGELYYAGLRYLRNRGNWAPWTNWLNLSPLKDGTTINADQKNQAIDGFPVITDWNDPLLRQGDTLASKAAVCRPNYIMYIGDTHTHSDNNVPNFFHNNPAPSGDHEVNPQAALNRLATAESNPFIPGQNVLGSLGATGQNASYGSIAGLSYWARTNDIRSDIVGGQYVHSIMIDVLQDNDYRVGNNGKNHNAFYWAAKYGGFRSNQSERDGGQPALSTSRADRARWTNDAAGASSIPYFSDGVPRNYAAANTPQAMVEAVNKAFNNVEALSDTPSQTALAVEQNHSGIVDLTAANAPLFLQSSYRKNDHGWQGDIIAYTLDADSRSGSPDFTQKWQLSSLLKRSHADSRKVFTRSGSGIDTLGSAAQSAGAAALFGLKGDEGYTAADLKDYVLGKSGKEKTATNPAGVFRPRPDDGLLGTVVNSSVTILPAPVSENLGSCRYSNFQNLKNRSTVYAFSANDGMLHIIDGTGSEKLAYIPSTALPKLKDYAAPQGEHLFINDGTPVVQEVCTPANKTAKSVIIGTAGRGGEAVYAVDATRIGAGESVGSSNILWEFSKKDDEDLGLTVHAPVPVQIKKGSDSVAAVVVSGGYNAKNDKGYIFILQTDTSGSWSQNSNYWKIPLGQSGVGAPKAIDTDKDGNIDRIYVGDEAGKLYRIDYNGSGWAVKTLFNGSWPITGAPDAHFSNGRYTVIFNTGQYFKPADGTAQGLQNYAYGLFDTDGSTIDESSLTQQQISTQVAAVGSRTYFGATSHALSANARGWRLQLPSGYIGIDDALIRRNRTAQFFVFSVNDNEKINTQNSTGNVCANNSGKSALIEVDLRNGGLYSKPIFDTNRDGLFNAQDQPAAMSVNENSLALKRKNMTVNNGVSKVYDGVLSHGDSNQTADEERLNRFKNGVRRISWREIF